MADKKKVAEATPEVAVDDEVTYHSTNAEPKTARVLQVKPGNVLLLHIEDGDYSAVCEQGNKPGQWNVATKKPEQTA